MTEPSTIEFKVGELVKLARVRVSGTVSEQHRQLLPMPTREQGEIRLVFLYASSLALPGRPVRLNPPSYQLKLAVQGARFIELKAVSSADFGQKHRPSDEIGQYALPAHLSYEESLLKLARLYHLLDLLLPQFATGKPIVLEELAAIAREFRQLFLLLAEPPLLPYYRAVGTGFVAWVGL